MRDVQLELPIRNRFICLYFLFPSFLFHTLFDISMHRVYVKVSINYIHLLLHINIILFFRSYISY